MKIFVLFLPFLLWLYCLRMHTSQNSKSTLVYLLKSYSLPTLVQQPGYMSPILSTVNRLSLARALGAVSDIHASGHMWRMLVIYTTPCSLLCNLIPWPLLMPMLPDPHRMQRDNIALPFLANTGWRIAVLLPVNSWDNEEGSSSDWPLSFCISPKCSS